MNIIKFISTLKPNGKKYKQICFWNRFIRTKFESILYLAFIIIAIFIISKTQELTALLLVAALVCVPIIMITTFNNDVNYHLENREEYLDAPCTFTIMNNGILAEIQEYNHIEQVKWEDITRIHNVLGYYMLFNKSEMLMMLDKTAIDDKDKASVAELMKKYKKGC